MGPGLRRGDIEEGAGLGPAHHVVPASWTCRSAAPTTVIRGLDPRTHLGMPGMGGRVFARP